MVAPYFTNEDRHVIIYHLLTEGKAWASLEGGAPVALEGGDVVVFPHGHAHLMGNGPPVEPVDNSKQIAHILEQGLRVARMGGGGEITRYVCGYMAGDPHLSRVILSGLPPLLKVAIRDDAAGRWLEDSIRFSVNEAGAERAGGAAFLAKLSEALFVETLRRHVAAMPESQTGWLAGACDPDVGRALALLHERPAQQWTLADLARATGVSRTILAERFQHYLGEPPMAYLTKWRLQLAAQRLCDTTRSIAEVSMEACYRSEAAFNRAFKREFGAPPAQFRREARGSRAAGKGAGIA
jgi:AraC-like DNA-binding protein